MGDVNLHVMSSSYGKHNTVNTPLTNMCTTLIWNYIKWVDIRFLILHFLSYNIMLLLSNSQNLYFAAFRSQDTVRSLTPVLSLNFFVSPGLVFSMSPRLELHAWLKTGASRQKQSASQRPQFWLGYSTVCWWHFTVVIRDVPSSVAICCTVEAKGICISHLLPAGVSVVLAPGKKSCRLHTDV